MNNDYENTSETLIQRASTLNDYLQRLEGNDYVTAKYKGYSSEGLTLAEIEEEIKDVQAQLDLINSQLDDPNIWW